MNSIILVFDPEAICLVPPQTMAELPVPGNDGMWRASSATSWLRSKDSQSYSPLNVVQVIQKVFHGESFTTPISSFGLLTVVGCLLMHICGQERYSSGVIPSFGNEYVSNMERSLRIWETLWRSHPHAENVPSKYGDPLMVDCLSLLGSAYYHLYMGPELQTLKRLARNPQCQTPLPPFRPQWEILKAVKYAASSWLVRAKLGIAHLQRTAALEFGGHVLVTAYESGMSQPFFILFDSNHDATNSVART
jgi:hypothetical protein